MSAARLPRHITVSGRDEVGVVSAEEFRRPQDVRIHAHLVAAMQGWPRRDIDIALSRAPMRVGEVAL